jgi:hypothetical protein
MANKELNQVRSNLLGFDPQGRCPMCKASFQTCPHSVTRVREWLHERALKLMIMAAK